MCQVGPMNLHSVCTLDALLLFLRSDLGIDIDASKDASNLYRLLAIHNAAVMSSVI